MNAHGSEFEEFYFAKAIGSAFRGFGLVVYTLHGLEEIG